MPIVTITRATDKHYTVEVEGKPPFFCNNHTDAICILLEQLGVDMDELTTEAAGHTITDRVWCPVKEKLPENSCKVLAFYRNSHGNGRIITAIYARQFEIGEDGMEIDDYCRDQYEFKDDDVDQENAYLPEGWYELSEGANRYFVTDAPITHWISLPQHPIH